MSHTIILFLISNSLMHIIVCCYIQESLASLVAEQKRIEEKLKQEEGDRLLAEALQSEFNQGKVSLKSVC